MRTLLLIVLTIVVIGIAAVMYVMMQPHTAPYVPIPRALATQPTAPQTSAPAGSTTRPQSVLQAGEEVWVTTYDEKTGKLARRFRGAHYDPRPDGTVDVTQPQAELFMDDGQMVRIEGARGKVIMPPDANRGDSASGPNAPPSRGDLYDVVISLFHADNRRMPALVCRMNNVAFDNDTLRFATESFTQPDGTFVPADQVPVQIRGQDYDFDGRGLTIRWNDRDRKLQLLEIAHGESLTLKSQTALQGITPTTSPTLQVERSHDRGSALLEDKSAPHPQNGGPPAQTPQAHASSAPIAEAVRSAGDANEPTTAPTSRQSPESPLYRATFDGGVNITQGDQPLALAEILRVDFRQEPNQPYSPAGSAKSPGGIAGARGSGRTRPGAASAAHAPRAQVPAPASSEPSAQPPLQPIVLRWPGKLVIAPLDDQTTPVYAGQMRYELESVASPVEIHHAGGTISCASCSYIDGQQSGVIRSSPRIPMVTIHDSGGSILHTPKVDYNIAGGKVVLDGASDAQVPVKNDQDQQEQILRAHWSKSCVLRLDKQSSNQLSIRQADIDGEVNIDHPRVKLDSDALRVSFAPPVATTQSSGPDEQAPKQTDQVKDLTAWGNVKCALIDDQQKLRHITSDRLVVTTAKSPEGQLAPHTVTADGNVHTFDDQQDLRAAHLLATLSPTTRPTDAPKVQSIFAQQDVRFAAADISGQCDQFNAEANGDDFNVTLSAQPAATVKTQKSTLAGPIIKIQPKRQNLQVVGDGSMHGVQESREQNTPPAPFDLSWRQSLSFDGATNHADISGNVTFSTVSSDGAVNTATGDSVTVELMDDLNATTRPAARPSSRPSTVPGEFAGGFDSMNKKALRAMSIDGNTEIKSVLADSRGIPLRRLHLFAPTVHVDAVTKQVVVPTAGRMLYEDARPTTQPAMSSASPGTAPAASPLGDMSGATAFRWAKQLIYDQNKDRAEMSGQVLIVHQDSSGAAEPFRLEAEHVVADMEPQEDQPAAHKKATAGAASSPGNSGQKIKRLSADGAVHFSSRQIQFDAEQVTYDPTEDVLMARGAQDVPVQVYDEKGVSTGAFEEIWWNSRTQQIVRLSNLRGDIRR